MSLSVVSAFLLANIAGHEQPTVAEVEKILKAAGGKADHASIEQFVSQIAGKSVHEVIASGRAKLFSAVAAAPAAGKTAAAASPKKAAAKKEEVKEEEEDAGDFSLFD